MNIDDILHPGESRRVEIARLNAQIIFLNHALLVLELAPKPAATLGNSFIASGLEEGQNNLSGTAAEVCQDCKGTGVRDRNIEGCDVESRCWCEAGDL